MGHIGEITGLGSQTAQDARTANTDHRALPVVDLGPLMRGEPGAVQKIGAIPAKTSDSSV